MNICSSSHSSIGVLIVTFLAASVTSPAADTTTLKNTYEKHFYVGVAINRTIATAAAVQANNVNRRIEQFAKDIALVNRQFSQISPENDLKWALIHPRECQKLGVNFTREFRPYSITVLS